MTVPTMLLKVTTSLVQTHNPKLKISAVIVKVAAIPVKWWAKAK